MSKKSEKSSFTSFLLLIAVIVIIVLAISLYRANNLNLNNEVTNDINSTNVSSASNSAASESNNETENKTDTNTVDNSTNTINTADNQNKPDYSGEYKFSDGSSLKINKTEVTVSIYKLSTMTGNVESANNGILYISGRDPNGNVIKFIFNQNTQTLTVSESNWNLLEKDSSFAPEKDYSGTYSGENNNSITIDGKNVKISIYKLANFDNCKIESADNDILSIKGTDGNGNQIKFTFDTKNKELKVTDSTWGLLTNGTIFRFN